MRRLSVVTIAAALVLSLGSVAAAQDDEGQRGPVRRPGRADRPVLRMGRPGPALEQQEPNRPGAEARMRDVRSRMRHMNRMLGSIDAEIEEVEQEQGGLIEKLEAIRKLALEEESPRTAERLQQLISQRRERMERQLSKLQQRREQMEQMLGPGAQGPGGRRGRGEDTMPQRMRGPSRREFRPRRPVRERQLENQEPNE